MPTTLTRCTAAALAAALLPGAACATGKESWDSVVKPEAKVEVIPNDALVEVDGKARGRGFATLDVSDPKRRYRVRASADGFVTEEAEVEGGSIADRHFFLALRPAGFGSGRRLDPRDAPSMAQAAAALWRAGKPDAAAEYAEQSLRGGNTALANRVLGDVWRRRGNRDRAVQYYGMYLSLAEDPPDAAEIKAWVSQVKGDITIPGGR
ncbi:MAG TPA: tetratricopeptide repeat protein [Anaeromyxobacteraceae bacterium]|nr:tetratricopeptide repeat protein [Anaeromyxobacteraceae bacterium]